MKTFLEHVADDIITKLGSNLSDVAVVFPNKRAALFLNEYLARKAGKPVWSPHYITISELFRLQSQTTVADNIKLICDLHKSFVGITGIDETLDHFFSWGQLLLSDFDDLDKNMGDAKQVFANISNLHELDDIKYLSDNQKETIRKFFSTFNEEHETELRQKFLQLWSRFADIYNDFRERLKQQNIAYEGMLYREVADKEQLSMPFRKYIFVGFNMLQKVEQTLFKKLQKEGKAMFYWDFDTYYLKGNNEAGHFIKDYLGKFPNELDITNAEIYDNLEKEKEITYISAHTEDIQARYINEWIRQNNRDKDGRRTAIVMCDEKLLTTVIHCLPETVNDVNITSGYPLKYTTVGTKIIQGIRNNSVKDLIKKLLDSREELVSGEENSVNRQLDAEALFRAYSLLNRIDSLIDAGDLDVSQATMQRLLSQLVGATTIPFHGEPVKGIQIMGVLETRNIDFDHVLLLSCNEGNMPKGLNDSSFIPHSIRKAFELTTVEHKTSIYSYYFHRLIQRAKDVTILYNNSTEDGNTGEMSRFMLQLLIESRHKIGQFSLLAGQNQQLALPSAIEKDEEILRLLNEKTSIYPTSINRYLRCPLQFYYRDIRGLDELEDDEEGAIDNRAFGNIFHKASELMYKDLAQRVNHEAFSASDLNVFDEHPELIELAVDQAIREELFDGTPTMPQLNGMQTINREVIIHYLHRLIDIDKQLAPFSILGTEKNVSSKTIIRTSDGEREITIGGFIDRLDQVTDPTTGETRIRVVDYKTGSRALIKRVNDIEEVFNPEMIREKHTDYYLQTMLYATMVRNSREYNPDELPVSPALLFIQHATGDDYDPTLAIGKEKITDIRNLEAEFKTGISRVLSEIFEPHAAFNPTEDRKNCSTCPFYQLCFR